MSARADGGGRRDDRRGVDTGRVGGRSVEELDRSRERQVGVRDAQSGDRRGREFGFDEDRGGGGGARQRGVFPVGDEAHLARAGGFEAGDTSDFDAGVAASQGGPEALCEGAQLHGGDCSVSAAGRENTGQDGSNRLGCGEEVPLAFD